MPKERGHYESVYSIMVDSPEYESLSLHATAVLWALKFSPENNRTGIFPIFREQVAARSKVPLEHVQDALRELEAADWIAIEGRWVWLRNHLRFDPHHKKGNPKHLLGLLAVISGLPKVALVERFLAYYRELGFLPKLAPGKAPLNRIKRGLKDSAQSNPVAVAVAVAGTNTPLPPSGGADQVFEHWRTALGKNGALFTPKRKRLVADRLREGYPVEKLLLAVDGCRASPFHMGDNQAKKRYDDLSLICRDGEHVEQFVGYATQARASPEPEGQKHGLPTKGPWEGRERREDAK